MGKTSLGVLDRDRFGRLLQAGFVSEDGQRRRIDWKLLVRKHWELLHSEDANVVQRELHWIEDRVLGLGRSLKVSGLPADDREQMERHLVELGRRVGGSDDNLGKAAGSA